MGRCPKCRTWKTPVRQSDAMTAEGTLTCPRCHTNLRASPLSGPTAVYIGAVTGLPFALGLWLGGFQLLAVLMPLFTAFASAFIDVWEVVPQPENEDEQRIPRSLV
jgi:hypothetical protein